VHFKKFRSILSIARRSRARKIQRLDELESRVHELERHNAALSVKLAVVDNEKANWHAKQQEYINRISQLEDQLREAHRGMSSKRKIIS
jgi:predicted  nucleic acid-binding Zn-ribbon protein